MYKKARAIRAFFINSALPAKPALAWQIQPSSASKYRLERGQTIHAGCVAEAVEWHHLRKTCLVAV
jgi:hypothetical protein